MNLLLVTGSRALDRTPAAAWWAQQQILGAMARLEHGADIVTGDALGPDEWARRLAITAGLTALVFNLYGRVIDGQAGWRWTEQARPFGDAAKRWPLVRNDAMVKYVAERAASGDRVRVLALTAGWATTRGTQYTAARARAAGLIVEACECPGELGPDGWMEVARAG
jgi:hypothetical protein